MPVETKKFFFSLPFVQVSSKDSVISELKEKMAAAKTEYDMAQKKIDTLQNYMADLPTAEDHAKRNQEISF